MNKLTNRLKLRLYFPGESGFEFYCAGAHTMKTSEGGKHLLVNFDWEVPDGNGDFDRQAGAPKAIEMFLNMLEINNITADESFGFDARKIDGKQYSTNGVWLSNIENFEIDIDTI